ncbi:hypothetical protein TGARI_271450 [Toxoplasma gondii ARI]|uniref:Uncharacterized protein n=1 Tax=Toxoplasma gondii ARI TaxID=1074872 RepID=A0A139Y6U2_TOXGO|nr:hypothetical protein TGARI_271450 [Toxoplasma gondii ARI]
MHIRERERGRDRQIERKMRKKEVLRIPQRCNRLGRSDSKQSPSFLFAFCSSFLKKTQTPIARHDCGTHSSPSTERQVHLFFGGSSSYRVSSVSSAFFSLLPPSLVSWSLLLSPPTARSSQIPKRRNGLAAASLLRRKPPHGDNEGPQQNPCPNIRRPPRRAPSATQTRSLLEK